MRTIHIFRGHNGLWFWHAKRAGRIVEDGSQGYTRRRDVIRAVNAKLRASYRVV